MNGKAGSGKSTLMRYVSDSEQTKNLLQSWAHPLPLTTASFYFWNSGTVEQASQVGLLRSLLFSILQEHRHLIPLVLPGYWAKAYLELTSQTFGDDLIDPWSLLPGNSLSLSTLMESFRQLFNQKDPGFKICLFIDGIDEYEGNIEEICQLFQTVASSRYVKICASSRPLLVIEDLYGNRPKLRLQDLTAKDIAFYITDNLNKNSRFRQLTVDEPQHATVLMAEIASRADGVFLWVRLVVRSLLDGLGNHDGIDDLQRRLEMLPTDLEELYQHMLDRLDSFYLTQASEFFQLLRAAREVSEITHKDSSIAPLRIDDSGGEAGPMTILTLVSSTASDSDLGISQEGQNELNGTSQNLSDHDQLLRKAKAMVMKVKSRGAMLIELNESLHTTPTLDIKVQYLHRTVRNFLEKPEIWHRLLSYTAGFDPHTMLLKSCLFQLKAASQLRHAKLVDVLPVSVSVAMAHAYYSFANTGMSNSLLLDNLNVLLRENRIPDDLCDGLS